MAQIIAKDNLGNSFEFDNVLRKINVKTDNQTIQRNSEGALELKTESVAFLQAVRSAETLTSLSTRVDATSGNRILAYTDEQGLVSEVDLSSFLADVSVTGGVLEGQVLKLTTDDSEIIIDLGVFITAEELDQTLAGLFDEYAVDAFGSQLFKVKSL